MKSTSSTHSVHPFLRGLRRAGCAGVLTLLGAAATTASAMESVNINTADATALAEGLDGVGPARAEAIVTHRDEVGTFSSAEDLTEVRGIGPAILEQNRERIRADAP